MHSLKHRHRVHILFMAYIMHAREPRVGGSRRMELQKERLSEGISFREFSLWKERKDKFGGFGFVKQLGSN